MKEKYVILFTQSSGKNWWWCKTLENVNKEVKSLITTYGVSTEDIEVYHFDKKFKVNPIQVTIEEE